ncbi:hypothetical protein JW921_11325 [Candidatus Fermentibacterales bacterium]|nr:hypothetical protein [Candidatus Fermentibacterales bacterium]
MRHALSPIGVAIGALLAAGCGEQPRAVAEVEGTTVDTLSLAVIDTIGVLTGDSTQEFGTVLKARFGPDGNICAVDGLKATLGVFSRDGELLRTIGGLGSGPGEFNFPSGFAFLRDGGMVVTDYGGHQLSFFDSSYAYEYRLEGFTPVAPVDPATGPGNTFVAGSLDLQVDEDGYYGTSDLGRYTGEGMEPEHVYRSYPLMIELRVVDGEQSVNVQNVDCVWDTDASGNVFFAVRSDSTCCVEVLGPDGTSSVIVEKEWERVAKTPEELAEGALNMGMSRSDDGTTTVRREEVEDVEPYHLAISTINADDAGNVWVGQGYTGVPAFEVYDASGTLLRVVTIPELEGVRELRFCFVGGMLAYDFAPVDYPKIYLLEWER